MKIRPCQAAILHGKRARDIALRARERLERSRSDHLVGGQLTTELAFIEPPSEQSRAFVALRERLS